MRPSLRSAALVAAVAWMCIDLPEVAAQAPPASAPTSPTAIAEALRPDPLEFQPSLFASQVGWGTVAWFIGVYVPGFVLGLGTGCAFAENLDTVPRCRHIRTIALAYGGYVSAGVVEQLGRDRRDGSSARRIVLAGAAVGLGAAILTGATSGGGKLLDFDVAVAFPLQLGSVLIADAIATRRHGDP